VIGVHFIGTQYRHRGSGRCAIPRSRG
jgi:hypothetical protein